MSPQAYLKSSGPAVAKAKEEAWLLICFGCRDEDGKWDADMAEVLR